MSITTAAGDIICDLLGNNVLSEKSASINCCLFVTVHIKFNSDYQVGKVKLVYVINTFCLFSQKMFEYKA